MRSRHARAGSDRERAVDEVSSELLHLCGLPSLRGFSPQQREAWRRLAPILALLDLGSWQHDERRAVVDLVRAKGGRSERDYVARYLAHPKFDAALRRHALNAIARRLPGGDHRFDRPSTTRMNVKAQDRRVIDALTAAGMVVEHSERTPRRRSVYEERYAAA